MRRVALFGGTFNPPTVAHEAVAGLAFDALGLSELLVCPNSTPPHKRLAAALGADDRLALCEALCAAHPAWKAIDWELRRDGTSYTIDTLHEFAAAYPGAQRWFICGADSAATLHEWEGAESFASLTSFAVIPRPGCTFDPSELQARLPGVNVRMLPSTGKPISSTLVRDLFAARDLVTAATLLPAGVLRELLSRSGA